MMLLLLELLLCREEEEKHLMGKMTSCDAEKKDKDGRGWERKVGNEDRGEGHEDMREEESKWKEAIGNKETR